MTWGTYRRECYEHSTHRAKTFLISQTHETCSPPDTNLRISPQSRRHRRQLTVISITRSQPAELIFLRALMQYAILYSLHTREHKHRSHRHNQQFNNICAVCLSRKSSNLHMTTSTMSHYSIAGVVAELTACESRR